MAKYNPIGVNKTDTLAADLAASATSATLTTGNFGTQTGAQLLVVDYDVPSKIEVIECTITGTALTSITRAKDGTSDVAHSTGAKVLFTADIPSYWTQLYPLAASNAYLSWTPSWTNLTIGNATTVAKYLQVGKTVDFYLIVTFGSTTSISGTVSVSYPVTPTSSYSSGTPLARLACLDDNTGQRYPGMADYQTSSLLRLNVDSVSGTLIVATTINATTPFTWTTSDKLFIHGHYEAD